MKNAIQTSLMDLLVGLVTIFLVFLVVVYVRPGRSPIIVWVSGLYLVAGLIRGRNPRTPLWLKLPLIALFGVLYIPLSGDSYSMVNLPYPAFAVVSTLIGLVISRKWEALTPLKRSLALAVPSAGVILMAVLVFPAYFQFWSSYVHGPAPELSLQTLSGETISLSELKGKVVLLDFWDTHCGPCRKLMPDLQELYLRHRDNPNIAILCVNAGWEPLEEAQEFAAVEGYDLPFAYDAGSKLSRALRVDELPTAILIDRQYQLHFKHVGFDAAEDQDLVADLGRRMEELLSREAAL